MMQGFAQHEFGGADLGDRRLNERLVAMGNAAMARPSAGLPKMMGSDADLEATYRFLNHPKVEPEQVLAPHIRRTVERCGRLERVWVAHDTTDILFDGESERADLGRVRNQKAGFEAHFSVAVQPGNEARHMLGVLEIQRFNAQPKLPRGRGGKPQRAGEPDRWLGGVQLVERSLGKCTRAVHLMDRAADGYELWARLCEMDSGFLIRLSSNRRVGPTQKLFERLDELACQPAQLQRTVVLSRRGKQRGSTLRKIHPPRDRRTAQLEVRACTLRIPRTGYCDNPELPESLQLNVVHVRERDTPEGCEPVDWKLITTEPIDTAQDIAAIVDAYRGRWVIEEYFKALKTGCALQQRQLESYQGLSMVLALLAPVAWRLLQLRSLAEVAPNEPGHTVLNPLQMRILRAKARDPFPDHPTVADVHFAIARMGGFLKHNKRPGWQVLGYGFEKLLLMEEGASAVTETECDQ